MAGKLADRKGYPLPTDTLNYAKGYREREEREKELTFYLRALARF
jgi:hypothetical protein